MDDLLSLVNTVIIPGRWVDSTPWKTAFSKRGWSRRCGVSASSGAWCCHITCTRIWPMRICSMAMYSCAHSISCPKVLLWLPSRSWARKRLARFSSRVSASYGRRRMRLMAALRLLNRKCGRMRAVSALRRASEIEGARPFRREAS